MISDALSVIKETGDECFSSHSVIDFLLIEVFLESSTLCVSGVYYS